MLDYQRVPKKKNMFFATYPWLVFWTLLHFTSPIFLVGFFFERLEFLHRVPSSHGRFNPMLPWKSLHKKRTPKNEPPRTKELSLDPSSHQGSRPKGQSSDEFAPNAQTTRDRDLPRDSQVLSGDCSTHNARPRVKV